jgi:hypothetical protein
MTPQPKEADEMKALVEPDDASWLHCLARGTLANTVLIAEPKVRKRIGRIAEALTRTPPSASIEVTELLEWALDKAATHHRLAHENEHLRAEHIASSSAYRNLADELRARQKDQG